MASVSGLEPSNEPKTELSSDRDQLSKKEKRRELLTELELSGAGASPEPTPEQLLRRAQQALEERNLEQCRRLLSHLQERAPQLPGLTLVQDELAKAEARVKREANLRTAEEMLLGYIQQRKKALAQLALDTLLDLVPDHPRKLEYSVWVKDLDQELALQKRIEKHLDSGREALKAGNLEQAAKHAESLRKLDPDGAAIEQLDQELAGAQHDRDETADIELHKERLEKLLADGDLTTAAREIEHLSHLALPKITLDFLRQRLAARRAELAAAAETKALEERFRRCLASRDWHAARELVESFSERFPSSPRTTEMFAQITSLEAAERREQSRREGIATVERFVAAGKRGEAELALQVLRRLDVEPKVFADLEQRVSQL